MSDLTLLEMASWAASLVAAERNGLLHALCDSPDTPEGFAARLALDTRAVELVLRVLATQGIAEHKAGRYGPGDVLRRGMRGPWKLRDVVYDVYAHGVEFLRHGRPKMPRTTEADARADTYRPVVAGLGEMFDASARDLAQALSAAPCSSLLDVGAGSGVWSLEQLRFHPQARLTALDLPGVVERVRERASSVGFHDDLEARLELLAGDMHEVELPTNTYDRIVLANVLHLEPPDRAERLLNRVAESLTSQGILVIVDNMACETPEEARRHAAYALYLALRIERGRPHPEQDLRRWLTAAGFPKARRIDLRGPAPGLSALVTAPR